MKLIGCCAILLVVGCKSDEEKILEPHKTKLKAQFDKIAALAPKVEKEPKLTSDTWPVPNVKWSDNIYTDPNGNALWAWSHQLVDACTNEGATFAKDNTGSDYISLGATAVSTSGGALTTPKCAVDGKMDKALGLHEKAVKYLVDTKYLLVVRPHEKVVPQFDEAERKAAVDAYLNNEKPKEVEHFVGGRLAGDALLYELDSGKLLGGFVFDARSSNAVEARGSVGNDAMRYDLTRNFEKLMLEKFGK